MGGSALIFITVGSVYPFDRLVSAADKWAVSHNALPLAQIGRSSYSAKSLKTVEALQNTEYRHAMASCSVVVAHAGMGSVLTAGELGKPIVIMPRLKALGEHNTDHQVDTADWMSNLKGVHVARDEAELSAKINYALENPEPAQIRTHADPYLIEKLKDRLNHYLS